MIIKRKSEINTIIVYVVLLGLILYMLSSWLKPIWRSWSHVDTIEGFYAQPRDSIETLFLGASIVANGIIPMQLYNDYGICAYNLGTEQQPMIASYYWLEEVYRYHAESLNNVVLDVSMLRRSSDEAFFRKAMDEMRISSVKYRAMKDYVGDELEAFCRLFSLYNYHDSWASLGNEEFDKNPYSPKFYLRGYNYTLGRALQSVDDIVVKVPSYYVNSEGEETIFNDNSLYYLKKLIDFCNSHDINLILIKTPLTWGSSEHNATQSIADRYGIDFIDFNFEPYIDDIGFNNILDSCDGAHLNFYGASKLTAWIGKYLVDNNLVSDVRDNSYYAFMNNEYSQFEKNILDKYKLQDDEYVCDYINDAVNINKSIVVISVRDDAASALSAEDREVFSAIGLDKLSELSFRSSYLAVVVDGNVLTEQSDERPDNKISKEVDETIVNNLDSVILNSELKNDESEYLHFEDTIYGIPIAVKSAGLEVGNISSIMIDDSEYSQNERGLNIVVYDYEDNAIIDTCNFDTCASNERVANYEEKLREELEDQFLDVGEDDLSRVYLYNRKCDNSRLKNAILLENKSVFDVIKSFVDGDKYSIIITAVADGSLESSNIVTFFSNIGLMQLDNEQLSKGYIGIIDDGKVIYNSLGNETRLASSKGVNYEITSGKTESGYLSKIIINNSIALSSDDKGLGVVIYDKVLDDVVASYFFDDSLKLVDSK